MTFSVFYITKRYAPSVLREALLNAGQFAHVPAREIEAFVQLVSDWPELTERYPGFWGRHVNELRWPVGVDVNAALRLFEERHRPLCPVCFTLVEEDDDVYPPAMSWDLMPSFLMYERRRELHDFAHIDCAHLVRELEWAANSAMGSGNPVAARHIENFFRRKGAPGKAAQAVADRCKASDLVFRFDPAKHVHRHDYADTRYRLDIDFTKEECARLWPGEAPKIGFRHGRFIDRPDHDWIERSERINRLFGRNARFLGRE